jgi:hypothetical protein
MYINQTTLPEKNERVRMMWDIYEQAKVVVLWLGEEQKD